MYVYSGAYNKGPSEMGDLATKDTCYANTLVYYFTSEIDTTSLQGTKLLAPICSLFGGSTVYLSITVR